MLTLTLIKNWAKNSPNNIKAAIKSNLKRLDFSYMQMDEDTHTYTSEKNPDVQWTSVTTAIKKYEPEQDWDVIASNYASKHGMQTHVVKQMWEYNNACAVSTGSTCHLFGELICNIMICALTGNEYLLDDYIYDFKIVFPFQFKDDTFIPCMVGQQHIITFWENVIRMQQRWPVAAELIVDDPTKGICGTIDLLMIEADGSLSIWDYKTTKSLQNTFNRGKHITLLNEHANMINEPLSIYKLQLDTYKQLLAYNGVISNNAYIIHIPNIEGSEMKVIPVNIETKN